jgi:FkbH-like protein
MTNGRTANKLSSTFYKLIADLSSPLAISARRLVPVAALRTIPDNGCIVFPGMLKQRFAPLNYADLVRESKRLDPSATSQKLRVALLADTATQRIATLLRVLFHRNSIDCSFYEGGFDGIELDVHDANSELYRFAPDVIVILNAVQALRSRFGRRSGDTESFVKENLDTVTGVWDVLRSHCSAPVIQSNFAMPYERTFGNYDLKMSQSFYAAVARLNVEIASASQQRAQVLINDIDALASWIGRRVWFDDRLWDLSKYLCAVDHLPAVAQNIVDIAMALRGRVIKCVVLDLDNTLWGGVIGDDGLEGIQLNSHGDGEAFYRFQLFLRELVKRGIILAVCSKNEMANALLPFEKHPEMVLKRDDIACFVANWNDKADNIRHIRETLNIGFDSMVFLDDNAFERSLVRTLVPDVIVPDLPEDPADYVRAISELNLFETTTFSAEDLHRSELYRLEEQRRSEQSSFGSLDEFLQSLKMQMTIARFDPYHLPRIAQLIQRSNQFNLTTRRLTESDCAELMTDPAFIPLYAKLSDRLGDHGLIGVVVLEPLQGELAIRDWLMSCRVLKRGVEAALMNEVFQLARDLGLTSVTGEFIPTAKNGMVQDFFAQFGFEKVSEQDGRSVWRAVTAAYQPTTVFIEQEIVVPAVG